MPNLSGKQTRLRTSSTATMNPSPMLPEMADVAESEFELEAAKWNYNRTLVALGRDLDNPLSRADFETARADLEEARGVMALAEAALEERTREFNRLNAALGEGAQQKQVRQKMDSLGFGGDDYGLDGKADTSGL